MSWVEWVEIAFKSIVVIGAIGAGVASYSYMCWRWGFEDGARAVADKMK